MIPLEGEIVGATRVKHKSKVTEFSVKKGKKIVELVMHGIHENLLSGRKIRLDYDIGGSLLWCESYSLIDESGKTIYERSSDY